MLKTTKYTNGHITRYSYWWGWTTYGYINKRIYTN